VCNERWTWVLVWPDGRMLEEHDEEGNHRAWPTQEAQRAERLVLMPATGIGPPIAVIPKHGEQVNFFRRHPHMLSADGTVTKLDVITIIALEKEYGNGHYLFIYGDGSLVLSDDLNAV
jgi:hypothetical protein